nr:MAG TPA: Tumor necrosis factor ligand superfamily receptor complex, IMMUNE RESPONSE.6A [Caudoviricetes sp.]
MRSSKNMEQYWDTALRPCSYWSKADHVEMSIRQRNKA